MKSKANEFSQFICVGWIPQNNVNKPQDRHDNIYMKYNVLIE